MYRTIGGSHCDEWSLKKTFQCKLLLSRLKITLKPLTTLVCSVNTFMTTKWMFIKAHIHFCCMSTGTKSKAAGLASGLSSNKPFGFKLNNFKVLLLHKETCYRYQLLSSCELVPHLLAHMHYVQYWLQPLQTWGLEVQSPHIDVCIN